MSDERNPQDGDVYRAVVNAEEQYSIWRDGTPNPPGWRDAGKSGTREECLSHIADRWTDMRPLSARSDRRPRTPSDATTSRAEDSDGERRLVERLSADGQAVEIRVAGRGSPASRLRQRLADGFVQVRFNATRGGTEISVALDMGRSDISLADFEREVGTLHLEGLAVLDDEEVRCVVDVALPTLEGTGRLVQVEARSDHDQ